MVTVIGANTSLDKIEKDIKGNNYQEKGEESGKDELQEFIIRIHETFRRQRLCFRPECER